MKSFLAGVALGALLVVGIAWLLWPSPPSQITDTEAREGGFVPPTSGTPVAHDMPDRTRLDSSHGASGGFRRSPPPTSKADLKGGGTPSQPGPSGPTPVPVAPPTGGSSVPVAISPDDLAVFCFSQRLLIEGRPYERLLGDAEVRLPDGSVVARGCGKGERCLTLDGRDYSVLTTSSFAWEPAPRLLERTSILSLGLEAPDASVVARWEEFGSGRRVGYWGQVGYALNATEDSYRLAGGVAIRFGH